MAALEDLGWDEGFAAAFRKAAGGAPGCEPGRVVSAHRGGFRVAAARGDTLATLAGKLRHAAETPEALPAVGDWVVLGAAPAGSDLRPVEAVLPRRGRFVRGASGKRAVPQVVAANVGVVFLVASLGKRLRLRTVERYLLLAAESGADPVVVLTKTDLCDDPAAAVRAVAEAAAGAPVHAVCALSGAGMEALAAHLPAGVTGALLGMSGDGKSTIVNRWCGHETAAVGEVRASDQRGRHTTTQRQLVRLPWGGLVIDTPGMRELQLWEVGEDGLGETFADIDALATQCRFSNCTHQGEPGCAVRTAVEAGDLDPARLASWRKLKAEKKTFETGQPGRRQAANRRRKGAARKRERGAPVEED